MEKPIELIEMPFISDINGGKNWCEACGACAICGKGIHISIGYIAHLGELFDAD